MHRYLRTGVRLAVISCAALVVALVLNACGGSDPQPDTHDDHSGHDHSHQLPVGDGPQLRDSPDESATEALQRIYSWEPATDADSGDGMRRAVPWLSGALHTVATRGDDESVRALPQWQQWRTNHDIVVAAVKVTARTDRPGDLDVERRALVTQNVMHADGTTTPWRLMTFDIALSRDDDQRWRMWRMDLIDTTTLGAAQ
ncbi:hypothetical protein [Gordonia sp. UCD-TK1]|uniref:hypothetical protein n=1 Tax=Gordonia sp. UCD-TK1 TaxID=1857893 RepID=UPI00080D967A|nr:hypothetical protein [Gordonia sp. UCD-TK1]OCH81465.1 hypothetical protein A9310_17425 [Gordonia sp. UCD-TK1]